MQTVNWGILGPGKIAHKFATALDATEGAKLVAVGSRNRQRAEAFAREFGADRAHEGYEALAADDKVDAIYVATPHPFHAENTRLCLEHGKAVLCEKPFTLNAAEARDIVALAREKNLFLMEAMWTRFLPTMGKVREWVRDGRIGEVRMIQADFGFRGSPDPEGRHLNPALGGGALLDVGIYPISFAASILGPAPDRVSGVAEIGETGVDEQSAFVLGWPGGPLAVLACGVRTRTRHAATILGTEGMIHIAPPFWQATSASLEVQKGPIETFTQAHKANGYEFEAEEVGRCLAEGRTESDTLPLDESIAIMEIMDRLREQWGLTYPSE